MEWRVVERGKEAQSTMSGKDQQTAASHSTHSLTQPLLLLSLSLPPPKPVITIPDVLACALSKRAA